MPAMPYCSAATAAPATAMETMEATTRDLIFMYANLFEEKELSDPVGPKPEAPHPLQSSPQTRQAMVDAESAWESY